MRDTSFITSQELLKLIVENAPMKKALTGFDLEQICRAVIDLTITKLEQKENLKTLPKWTCLICGREQTPQELKAGCDPEGMTAHFWIQPTS